MRAMVKAAVVTMAMIIPKTKAQAYRGTRGTGHRHCLIHDGNALEVHRSLINHDRCGLDVHGSLIVHCGRRLLHHHGLDRRRLANNDRRSVHAGLGINGCRLNGLGDDFCCQQPSQDLACRCPFPVAGGGVLRACTRQCQCCQSHNYLFHNSAFHNQRRFDGWGCHLFKDAV
jgi:hypothetical protein